MKTMDEFGSVLTMAALVLGACAAADWLFLIPAADSAGADQASAENASPKFMAVAHRDQVVLAERTPVAQPTRLSW